MVMSKWRRDCSYTSDIDLLPDHQLDSEPFDFENRSQRLHLGRIYMHPIRTATHMAIGWITWVANQDHMQDWCAWPQLNSIPYLQTRDRFLIRLLSSGK